jgi:Tol biopolymer transport system component
MTKSAGVRPPRAGDPYGLGPVGSWLAPVLSIIGLVLVGVVTVSLLTGNLPFGIGKGGSSNGNGNGNGSEPGRSAAPSNVVIVPPDAKFDGSIIYAKAGNIWIQTADGAKQVTNSNHDSMPSWSPDGQWIYFIRTRSEKGRWLDHGVPNTYALEIPSIMRAHADGSGEEQLKDGGIKQGNLKYAYWLRQPVISPDGSTVAVMSDAPNPDNSTVVLQFLDTATGKLRSANMPTNGVLGHQDPDWRPDGKYLLYVQNGRDGTRGAPVIMRYTEATGRARALTGFGYLNPAYSRDGKYIAATKTSAFGTDVVILDGSTGQELLRVTDDGSSWAPTWSPKGDGIAFLHLDGQTVDLRLARLDGAAPGWTVKETIDLTEVSDLGPESRPDWFIPADQLPALSSPPASSSAAPAASGSTTP